VTGLLGVPRVRLATLPTPLHHAPGLSRMLGTEVWFKRDDLTGFGLGGNKVRGLEYLLADAGHHGCDVLVTGGGPQSNWAMLAALAARTRGLDCALVSFGTAPAGPPAGNQALAVLAGAVLHFTGDADRASADRGVDELCDQLRAQGRRPYGVHRGGATGVGALGYVAAGLELAAQLQETGLRPRQLWLATGSCGTQAGLAAAAAWLRPCYEVIGVTVSRPAGEARERVATIAAEAAAILGTPAPCAAPRVLDGFLGPAKGSRSPAGAEAAALAARTEGIFLDPVFGAKAMAGLIASVRGGTDVAVEGPVVFLVTGGAPTLFTA
jgi:1-aminocyclopropane-1-carboxylate deaminase/D-cysteine desulfhydrase-like pyridoxal-dependent ACC family enzyme